MAYLESLQCPINAFGEIANSGNVSPARNLMYNGNFDFWQRGTSFPSLTVQTQYGPDRWRAFRLTASTEYSMSQVSITAGDVPGAAFGVRMQRDSGTSATNAYGICQMLPNVDSREALGQYLVVSFWARAGSNYSSTSNALAVALGYGTGTNQAGSGIAFTGETNVINTTVTLTTSWQRFTTLVSTQIPAATATQVQLNFNSTPTGTAGANDYFDIARVSVTPGRFATPFTYRSGSYWGEYQALLAFYEKTFALATTPAAAVSANRAVFNAQIASGTMAWFFPFKATKRSTSPTVTLFNPITAASAEARNLSVGADFTASSAAVVGSNGFEFNGTVPASTAIGNTCAVHYTASAEL